MRNARPICFPNPLQDLNDQLELIASGWGLVGEDLHQSGQLKQIKMNKVPRDQCDMAYGGFHFINSEFHLCAYGQGKYHRLRDSQNINQLAIICNP